MNVVIYESSSRGGNYDYSLRLLSAYSKHSKVTSAVLLLPSNAKINAPGVRRCLVSDRPLMDKVRSKASFLMRQLANPFILIFFLLFRRKCLVVFNDFEQISSPLWSPVFRLLLSRHITAVVLHDPDRDSYPPSKAMSEFTMKMLMGTMDLGLYHERLPDRPYYHNKRTKYINVPHGLYALPEANTSLFNKLNEAKKDCYLFSIIGNIRWEKNYHSAIKCLVQDTRYRLLIAGSPASSSVSIQELSDLAKSLGVSKQILWEIKYLSDDEFSAIIEASDCILLNYAASFKSQSGILFSIAAFDKPLIVSDTDSALTQMVRTFKLGTIIPPDSDTALATAMHEHVSSVYQFKEGWKRFIESASWSKHVDMVINAYEAL